MRCESNKNDNFSSISPRYLLDYWLHYFLNDGYFWFLWIWQENRHLTSGKPNSRPSCFLFSLAELFTVHSRALRNDIIVMRKQEEEEKKREKEQGAPAPAAPASRTPELYLDKKILLSDVSGHVVDWSGKWGWIFGGEHWKGNISSRQWVAQSYGNLKNGITTS